MRENDPAILFVKPKAISRTDKKVLQDAGVIVVEVVDPNEVKLTRAYAEISSSAMLKIAAKVIAENSSTSTREAFGRMICDAIMAA